MCLCEGKSINDWGDKTWAQSKNSVRIILLASLYVFAGLVSVCGFVHVTIFYSRITTKRGFKANDVSNQQQAEVSLVGYC